jgi:hypothetical protein
MWFCAFAVFLSGAIYVSPMFCGSNMEKKMLSQPQEMESGGINCLCFFMFTHLWPFYSCAVEVMLQLDSVFGGGGVFLSMLFLLLCFIGFLRLLCNYQVTAVTTSPPTAAPFLARWPPVALPTAATLPTEAPRPN